MSNLSRLKPVEGKWGSKKKKNLMISRIPCSTEDLNIDWGALLLTGDVARALEYQNVRGRGFVYEFPQL